MIGNHKSLFVGSLRKSTHRNMGAFFVCKEMRFDKKWQNLKQYIALGASEKLAHGTDVRL